VRRNLGLLQALVVGYLSSRTLLLLACRLLEAAQLLRDSHSCGDVVRPCRLLVLVLLLNYDIGVDLVDLDRVSVVRLFVLVVGGISLQLVEIGLGRPPLLHLNVGGLLRGEVGTSVT
jgi:hypothetical protein